MSIAIQRKIQLEISKESDSGTKRGRESIIGVRPDTIRGSNKLDGNFNIGSNSVDDRPNITNMGSNGKDGSFKSSIEANGRGTDQESDRRKIKFDGKEGRLNRISEEKIVKCQT